MSKKEAIQYNNIGNRLRYVRDKLGLTIQNVSNATGIPIASYSNLENNQRTGFYEQLYRISRYFNGKWLARYSTFSDYPMYNNEPLTNISILWIMFGEDYLLTLYETKLKERESIFEQREQEYLNTIEELKIELSKHID